MIILHFIVFIVTIFCFAYAFYCLSDVKCFALLSRDYFAFYCVYRDYFLVCICFLLCNMFHFVVTLSVGFSVVLIMT